MNSEQRILEDAQSVPACLMAAYIEDVKEGNPSKWLLDKLNKLWDEKLRWGSK